MGQLFDVIAGNRQWPQATTQWKALRVGFAVWGLGPIFPLKELYTKPLHSVWKEIHTDNGLRWDQKDGQEHYYAIRVQVAFAGLWWAMLSVSDENNTDTYAPSLTDSSAHPWDVGAAGLWLQHVLLLTPFLPTHSDPPHAWSSLTAWYSDISFLLCLFSWASNLYFQILSL